MQKATARGQASRPELCNVSATAAFRLDLRQGSEHPCPSPSVCPSSQPPRKPSVSSLGQKTCPQGRAPMRHGEQKVRGLSDVIFRWSDRDERPPTTEERDTGSDNRHEEPAGPAGLPRTIPFNPTATRALGTTACVSPGVTQVSGCLTSEPTLSYRY